MARRASLFMNCTLVLLAILGILFILSGHSQTFLNKEGFVNIVKDDLKEEMKYKKGGTQFVSPTLKKAENIKLYQ